MKPTTLHPENGVAPSRGRAVLSLALRIALESWLLAMATLILFILVISPQMRKTFLDQLDSKANSVALSLQDATAGAAINEDYASVISSARTMIEGDPALDFLIVIKNDGFSLVIERNGWRVDELSDAYWLERPRVTSGNIATVPLFDRQVFHYVKPFDYSSIQWGWIHVGLSLEEYKQSIASLTKNALMFALGCIALSFLISWFLSQQVVRPILRLRSIVQKVADGDFSVRAEPMRHDELGSLSDSINTMTEALLRRDRILESIRFAAQQFMNSPQWETTVDSMLYHLGTAAAASRAYVFENWLDDTGRLCASPRFQWAAEGVAPLQGHPNLKGVPYAEAGFMRWAEIFSANEIIRGPVSGMAPSERAALELQNIRSLIVTPIFVEGHWWGFIGLDDCSTERAWTDAENDSLRAGADIFGATIARQRVEEALVEAKSTLEQRVQERTRELETQVAAKEAALKELAAAQSALMEFSRAAGMAEVATSVLHNVGNVLNSVNVSCTLLGEQLRDSRIDRLSKVAELIANPEGGLVRFLSEDPRGRQIPEYIAALAEVLAEEHREMQNETETLKNRIEHIKEIVAMQQSYSRVSGVWETLFAHQLMEDALKLNAEALTRHRVSIKRQYESPEPITVDKHTVMQILLNLINNAKYACADSDREEKTITLRILQDSPGRIRMQVADNGVGISRDDVTRIFRHGFTTKKSGHGFGLHSGALAARKLGGSLSVQSNGPGHGATFTLELPCRPGGNHDV